MYWRIIRIYWDPLGTNYSGVVSRNSVYIAFTMTAMNGLDVCVAKIQNVYIQAPRSKKHYVFVDLSLVSTKVKRH